jgi:hypothetical protein
MKHNQSEFAILRDDVNRLIRIYDKIVAEVAVLENNKAVVVGGNPVRRKNFRHDYVVERVAKINVEKYVLAWKEKESLFDLVNEANAELRALRIKAGQIKNVHGLDKKVKTDDSMKLTDLTVAIIEEKGKEEGQEIFDKLIRERDRLFNELRVACDDIEKMKTLAVQRENSDDRIAQEFKLVEAKTGDNVAATAAAGNIATNNAVAVVQPNELVDAPDHGGADGMFEANLIKIQQICEASGIVPSASQAMSTTGWVEALAVEYERLKRMETQDKFAITDVSAPPQPDIKLLLTPEILSVNEDDVTRSVKYLVELHKAVLAYEPKVKVSSSSIHRTYENERAMMGKIRDEYKGNIQSGPFAESDWSTCIALMNAAIDDLKKFKDATWSTIPDNWKVDDNDPSRPRDTHYVLQLFLRGFTSRNDFASHVMNTLGITDFREQNMKGIQTKFDVCMTNVKQIQSAYSDIGYDKIGNAVKSTIAESE